MPTNPTWEWRTFGPGCEEAERLIRTYPLETTPRRATHIVCSMSGADVRLADGELVVRVLRQTSGVLEQWRTVLQAPVPVDDITVRRLFGYMDMRPPTPERASYTLHQFLEEIVAPQHALTVVHVGQRCHAAAIFGCVVDLAELMIDESPGKTIGIEGDDQSAVRAALAHLDLTGRPSLNIVAALKQQLAAAAGA